MIMFRGWYKGLMSSFCLALGGNVVITYLFLTSPVPFLLFLAFKVFYEILVGILWFSYAKYLRVHYILGKSKWLIMLENMALDGVALIVATIVLAHLGIFNALSLGMLLLLYTCFCLGIVMDGLTLFLLLRRLL